MIAAKLERCAACNHIINPGDEYVTKPRAKTKQACVLHTKCWDEHVEGRRAEARRASIARNVNDTFAYCARGNWCEQATGGLPEFEFARFENIEFRRRASKKMLVALEKYSLDKSLMLSAPTGVGKTALCCALLHREIGPSIEEQVSRGEYEMSWQTRFRPRFFFVTGHELSSARRSWKLGEEAPIIDCAKTEPLVILDDLGFEPLSELVFETIDHRYRRGMPTIVTTGLRPTEFRERYGDAAYRRLAQDGALVQDWMSA